MNDLKFAFRQLLKNPAFAAVAIITLALGIGANTAIFSIVNGVLLKPLPYQEPERIMTILHGGVGPVAPADFLDWRAQSQSFERMAAAQAWGGTLTGSERPETIAGISFGEGLSQLLGVAPLLGRTFQADDYQPGHEHVLVLSHQLWQRRFGGSPGVIGQSVNIDNQAYAVIGIMPPEFRFAPFWVTQSEMWAPLSLVDRATSRGGNSLRIFGRLKHGVTREQAQREMDVICRRLEKAFPETNTGRTVRVDALIEKAVGDIRRALLVLLGSVVFVLLIACANVANLLLVRAAAREKEMAIRAALGAGRMRTIRQLLTECVLLSSLAGILGVGIGFFGVKALKTYLEGTSSSFRVRFPRVHDISVDTPTLLFTLGIALFTGLIFGLAPVLRSAKANLHDTLKESVRGSSSARRSGRFRSSLIVAEVALALVMLIGAGLLMRSFVRLTGIDPGFKSKNVLTMVVSLSGQKDFSGPRREMFYEQLFQRIEGLPGIQSASAINHLPLAGDVWGFGVAIEGRPLAPPGQGIGAVYRVSRPKYFSTVGIPVVRGRDFTPEDRIGSPGVVIVNENFVRKQFVNENPIGKRLTLDDPQRNPQWLTIVGIVKNTKQSSWTDDVSNEIYLPWLQSKAYLEDTAPHVAYMTLVIRTAVSPRTLVSPIQNEIWSLNKSAPISSVMSLEEVVANAVWQQRFNLILIGLFATLAVILASIGIYGVMAYSVAQRTQEIGIRLALGAQRADLLRQVIGQGMRLVIVGAGIGLAAAFAGTRIISSLLYQVKATDTSTFLCVSTFLILVALFACWLPARRATKIDPIEALRYE